MTPYHGGPGPHDVLYTRVAHLEDSMKKLQKKLKKMKRKYHAILHDQKD